MIYNQLKKYIKKSLEEKPHLKKKRSCPGSPRSRVDLLGWSGLAGFLH
jgi:hypothetical protein